MLAALIDFVHATDRYPTIDSFGTARTIACLEHALAGLEPAAATAAP